METVTTIDLKALEELAQLQFSIAEIAIIMEFDGQRFETDEALSTAFMRGRLKAQSEVRLAVFNAAKQGSTPAQKQFQEMAELSKPDVM